MRLRGMFLAIALALAGPAKAVTRTFSPDAARSHAEAALVAGYPQDAVLIAQALIARDPQDVLAWLYWAEAVLIMGDPATAKAKAGQALELATTDSETRKAARLMARASVELGQATRAQFWLRRALEADDGTQAEGIKADYKFLRQNNPLSVALRISLEPSSNVNNGSSATEMLAPLVGPGGITYIPAIIAPGAQALAGWRSGIDGTIGWSRPRALGGRDSWTLDMRYSAVAYTPEAEAIALTPAADLAEGAATLAYRYQASSGLHPGLRVALGHGWVGARDNADWVSVAGDLAGQAGTWGWNLSLGQDRARYATDGVLADTRTLRAGAVLPVPVGRLNLSTTARQTTSDDPGRSLDALDLALHYDLPAGHARPQMAFDLSTGWQYNPATLLAPDGRSDQRLAASVTTTIPGIEAYGFLPTATLRWSRTQSNVALYETQELGLSFGFRSAF